MDESDSTAEKKRGDKKRFWKDCATLHLPLVIVLLVSSFATLNQFHRWTEGVDRSFSYMIQWPIIGIFAIVVWNRYQAKERTDVAVLDEDPETQAWKAYVTQLHREDPPGGPPERAAGN